MGIIKKALHSKIDVFVKFESAINLEIRGQIKKKDLDSFYLGHRDHMYAFSSKSGSEPFSALGDLTWNDPAIEKTHCVYHIIAEKYRPEPGVERRVSCLTYERVTN